MKSTGVAACLWLIACQPAEMPIDGEEGPVGPDGKADRAVTDWDRKVARPTNDFVAGWNRKYCQYRRGSLPAETLGSELPVDSAIPIKNIVVLMQENRSFDSYFGHLRRYGIRKGHTDATVIEAASDYSWNPEWVATPGSPEGPRHYWHHASTLCLSDTNHEWAGSHLSYDDGKMDGFFQANQGFRESGQPEVSDALVSGNRALGWYDERDIPFYYDLASTFAIADHYHSSLLGPTYPNRDYLYAASSLGVTDGSYASGDKLGSSSKNMVIFDELQKRGIPWHWYVHDIPHIPRVAALVGASFTTRWLVNDPLHPHLRGTNEFFDDAMAGTLPPVTFIDANLIENVNGTDEHPPADIQLGEKFVSDVVHALFASPQWSQTALFILYDEHGGIYDHVAPPQACIPDGYPPEFNNDEDREAGGTYDRLGVRVPATVVSPYAKRSYVSHTVYDHASVARFIEAKFKLGALTSRDANADPMFDMFDFENPPFMTPPFIPEATVDQARLEECKALYNK